MFKANEAVTHIHYYFTGKVMPQNNIKHNQLYEIMRVIWKNRQIPGLVFGFNADLKLI